MWHQVLKWTKQIKNLPIHEKVTNTSTFIIKLEPSSPKEICLESKIPTDVLIFSVTGVSVTPEIRIPIKK